MTTSRFNWFYSTLACLIIGLFLLPKAVSALTITPVLNELEMEPGEKVIRSFEIINNEKSELTLLLQASDVRFDKYGTPQFLKTDRLPPDSLLWWLTFDKEPIKLKPGEKKTISYTLSTPKDAPPGGHYAAFLISNALSEDKNNQTALALKTELASLIYLNVGGEVNRNFNIQNFRTNKSVYESLPIEFSLTLVNEGNTHFQPHGIIKIFNFRGKEIGKIIVNENSSYLYPKQTKDFNFKLEKFSDASLMDLFFGKFTAQLTLNAQDEAPKLTEISFLILPIKLIIAAFVVLILAILGFFAYHKSLVKKAQNKEPRMSKKI